MLFDIYNISFEIVVSFGIFHFLLDAIMLIAKLHEGKASVDLSVFCILLGEQS